MKNRKTRNYSIKIQFRFFFFIHFVDLSNTLFSALGGHFEAVYRTAQRETLYLNIITHGGSISCTDLYITGCQ